MLFFLLDSTCRVETWGGQLDVNTNQASINQAAVPGVVYQVNQFYNGIGSIDGVSSGRVIGIGCMVDFKDNQGTTLCVLPSGDYKASVFNDSCGNDVVTQYTIQIAGNILAHIG